MTEWILSSSVLILLVIALRYCLKGKISLRLQYALWGLVLVRLLMPFSIGSSELSVMNLLPEQKQEAGLNSNMPDNMEGQKEGTANLLNIVIPGEVPADVRRAEMQSDKMTGRIEDNTTEHGIVASSIAEEVAGKVPVYLSGAVDTPCLFGLFRPSIYVTNETTENETSQHHILEHE